MNKGRNRKVLLLKLRRNPGELERLDVELEKTMAALRCQICAQKVKPKRITV